VGRMEVRRLCGYQYSMEASRSLDQPNSFSMRVVSMIGTCCLRGVEDTDAIDLPVGLGIGTWVRRNVFRARHAGSARISECCASPIAAESGVEDYLMILEVATNVTVRATLEERGGSAPTRRVGGVGLDIHWNA